MLVVVIFYSQETVSIAWVRHRLRASRIYRRQCDLIVMLSNQGFCIDGNYTVTPFSVCTSAKQPMKSLFGEPEKCLPIENPIPLRGRDTGQASTQARVAHRFLITNNRSTMLGMGDGHRFWPVRRFEGFSLLPFNLKKIK